MTKNQLINTIRRLNMKKMSREYADMIKSMNQTKKRVEASKPSDAKVKSITITSGI
jgi:hypothetical protein